MGGKREEEKKGERVGREREREMNVLTLRRKKDLLFHYELKAY